MNFKPTFDLSRKNNQARTDEARQCPDTIVKIVLDQSTTTTTTTTKNTQQYNHNSMLQNQQPHRLHPRYHRQSKARDNGMYFQDSNRALSMPVTALTNKRYRGIHNFSYSQ